MRGAGTTAETRKLTVTVTVTFFTIYSDSCTIDVCLVQLHSLNQIERMDLSNHIAYLIEM